MVAGTESARPSTPPGDVLAMVGGVVFLFVLMMLPMVGPSGARTPHHAVNFTVFLLVLFGATAFAFGALALKISARRVDRSRFPFATAALCASCAFLLIALLGGLLRGSPLPS